MLALMILTIIALGSAAYIYHGRALTYAQGDRMTVLELVQSRLELLRAEDYANVHPPAENYNTYWMRPPQGGQSRWRFYTSQARQRLNVNSRRYFMTTTVRYVDADGGSPSYDALLFTVSMRYRQGSTDEIKISTYRSQGE